MENQLLNIKINQDDLNAAIANAAKARTELDKLKATNKELEAQKKELMKADGDQSAAITKLNEQISKNNAEIKANSTTIRQNEKLLVDNTAAQNANKGSITQLREQLKIVSKQWADLSEEERENTEAGRLLAQQKLELTNKLKEEEKATGDTRRNVGNYSEAIKEAIEQSKGLFGSLGTTVTQFISFTSNVEEATNNVKEFNTNIKNIINSQGGLSGIFKTLISGLRTATVASLKFLATPLGAVIGALGLAIGTVVGAFKAFRASLERTEKGQAAIAKITGVFTGVINGLMKVLEPLATLLANGVAAGFDLIIGGVAKASGAIQKALRFLGLNSWADGLKNITSTVGETTKSAIELADAERELNQIRREQEKIQLASQKRAEELRQIRDDESRSIEDRIKANEELGQVLEEQQQRELALAQRQLEIAQLRAEVEGESPENLDAIADAETKILEIEERITGQRSEQLTNVNALKKEEQSLAEERKKQEERARQEEEARQARILASFESLKKQLEEEEDLKLEFEEQFQTKATEIALASEEEKRLRVKEAFAQGLIDRQEYNEQLAELDFQADQLALLNAELAKEDALNDLELSEQERQRIIQESENVIFAIKSKQADKEIELREKTAKSEKQIEAEKERAKMQLRQMAFATFIEIAGRESALGKALSVSQASINTYEAATAALGMKPYTPANIALAALTVAQGLMSVQKIVATPRPSFAQGGFTGDGYGSPDSSGYKPAGIVHEGEYVIKKSMVDNPAFSGIINTLERSRLRGYADGGFVSRSASLPATQGLQNSQLQNTLSELRNMQPIVKVTDINRVSGQAQMVRVSGELS